MDTDRFETVDGQSVTAVTADEMRSVDRVAVEEFGLGLLGMMENAGRTLAGRVRALRPDGVVVVAGNGGNGGGGLCCARHLANRGADVSVVLDREPAELDGAAATQHGTLARMDVPVGVGVDALDDHEPEVVVDALVGYGLDGPLAGPAADLVEAIEELPEVTVSLDVPSGLDATSGSRPGPSVDPETVVTLALPKTGLGKLDCTLLLADIGIPAGVYDQLDVPYDSPFPGNYWVGLSKRSRFESVGRHA